MTPLTDTNYKDVLNSHFESGEIVVCGITPTSNCSQCAANQKTAELYMEKNPVNNIRFCFVDYSKYDILNNYYQLHDMIQYPKIIVFYGSWDVKEFIEGVLTLDKLEEINSKSPIKP